MPGSHLGGPRLDRPRGEARSWRPHLVSFLAGIALLALLSSSAALAQSGGQTLYDGITLPAQWPPTEVPTQDVQTPSYLANPPAVIPIDLGRQFFVDDFLIQLASGLTRTQHVPTPYANNPVLAPGPLDNGFAMPFSDGVWFDPADKLFKMWFFCAATCYAYSTDGKNWIRPSYPDAYVANTDEVLPGGTLTVWMDLQDPNPLRKFKAFIYNPSGPPIMYYFSADGIHWNGTIASLYPIPLVFDKTSLFWNPFRNVWVDSLKNDTTLPADATRPARVSRFRNYAESPNLQSWTLAGATGLTSPSNFPYLEDPDMLLDSFWTAPDANDPPYYPNGNFAQLYNLDAVAYESLMVGLFSWYYPGPAAGTTDDPNSLPGPDIVELGAGFSRDGFQWLRPTRGSGPGPNGAFIPASNQPGTWNMGNTQSAGGGFLVVGDQLYFYYSGRTAPHSDPYAVGATGLSTMRRDGFYSMDSASGGSGTLTTRPVQFSKNTLFVNVSIPQGSLTVQLFDANSNALLATSNTLANVDSTLQQVTWSNGVSDLSSWAGQPVKFVFTLTNGELYSFWVTDPSGASNGYVAANGPGFTGVTDTLGSAAYQLISVTPGVVTLSQNQTQQFAANAITTTNQAVNWSLNPNIGNISASGLYTAPASIASAQTVTVVATSTTSASIVGTATINLSPTTGVNFVGRDNATAGNWQGVYGGDGYALASPTTCQSIPGYATFSQQNQSLYQWAASTSDSRGLQTPAACGGGRSAQAWYNLSSPSSFSFSINFGAASRQFALYAVDWDFPGDGAPRAEMVQITDAATNALLDSRVIANFSGGVYFVWNISGSVKIAVTSILGTNAVVSGVFFGGNSAGTGREIVSVSPNSNIVFAGGSEQLTATIRGTLSTNQTINWVLNPQVGAISASGLYTAPPSISASQNLTVTATDQDGVSGTATITLSTSSTTRATVSFVKQDTTTQGAWLGTYGSDGYDLATGTPQDALFLPSYAAFAVQSQSALSWAASTNDPRALFLPSGAGQSANSWLGNYSFDFDVNFTDGASHQFALYAVDWDLLGRSETIQIADANTNLPLDTETISSFQNGVYLVWNISGHVKVNITSNLLLSVVVSGVFFGGGGPAPEWLSISPVTATVAPGTTKQFGATIGGTGKQNQTVSWSVTPAVGTISSTGLYSAPVSAISAQTVTIVAADQDGATDAATLNLTAGSSGVPAVVSYVGADTSTQGNWQSVYGGAGYVLANVTQQNVPGYLTFALQSQSNYTWAPSTGDSRALQLPGGGRIASTWYSSGTFNIDLTFSDGNSHQVALYAVDWDAKGRAETIKIIDPFNPGTALDSRNVSNFTNGIYLIWNISGEVVIQITGTSGPNGVISGVFFGTAASVAPQITSAANTTFTVGSPGTFTVTATGSPAATLSETPAPPSGINFNTATGVLSGTPASGTAGSYTLNFTANNGVSPNGTQSFTLNINPQPVNSGATASFVKADTTTQGSWIGSYGADGYDLANGPQLPAGGVLSYGTYAVQSQSNYTWAATTADPRGLQNTQGSRIAATWYSGTNFTFDVNITGTHQVALYVMDWDSKGRGETIQVLDASNPANVLDSRAIPNANTSTSATNFVNGTYLVWNVSGHVTIKVSLNAGPNAVVAGIFFGGTSQVAPSITSAASTNFTAGTFGSFTVTTAGSPTAALSKTGAFPGGVNFMDNGNGTATISGTPAANTGGMQFNFTITANNGVSPNYTQNFMLTVAVQASNTATWVKSDTVTQGTWSGIYGTQGYLLATGNGSIQNFLVPVTISMQNQLNWAWAASTTDTRALTFDAKGDRTAACWFNSANFTAGVNFADGQTHQLAIYVIDWDSKSRAETVSIADGVTGQILDTRSIPNANAASATFTNTTSSTFVGGAYLIWNVSGNVQVTVTASSGPNAVVSGIFIDP